MPAEGGGGEQVGASRLAAACQSNLQHSRRSAHALARARPKGRQSSVALAAHKQSRPAAEAAQQVAAAAGLERDTLGLIERLARETKVARAQLIGQPSKLARRPLVAAALQ